MSNIHPTTILNDENGPIEIGEGTTIGPFCYIEGPAKIGKNNKIYPQCIIGTEGEHKTATPTGPMIIGDDNVIREMFVMQRGTGDRNTEVGNNCYIMDRCHMGHDVFVGDNVTIAPNASLGGHMVIFKGATIGMGSSSHQYTTVGAYAMVGMEAAVTKDVPPFCLVRGNPAKFGRLNTHSFEKVGISTNDVVVVARYIVFKSDKAKRYLRAFQEYSNRKLIVEVIEQ